jgi:hypothetical protein
LAFFGKSLIFHPATEKPYSILSGWAENCFAVTYGYLPEVILSVSENLTFFFFCKIIRKSTWLG